MPEIVRKDGRVWVRNPAKLNGQPIRANLVEAFGETRGANIYKNAAILGKRGVDYDRLERRGFTHLLPDGVGREGFLTVARTGSTGGGSSLPSVPGGLGLALLAAAAFAVTIWLTGGE